MSVAVAGGDEKGAMHGHKGANRGPNVKWLVLAARHIEWKALSMLRLLVCDHGLAKSATGLLVESPCRGNAMDGLTTRPWSCSFGPASRSHDRTHC